MIARVNGPTTTTRRLVSEPAKSAPPQPVAQPTPIRITATAAIEQAGRYTRDDTADLSRLACPTSSLRDCGSGGAGGRNDDR